MVHLSIVVLACSLTAFASPFVSRDIPQVKADIAKVTSYVDELERAIHHFPSGAGSLAQAFAIHVIATRVESALGKATSDIKNTRSFDETDGTTILDSVQAVQPTIVVALKEIAAKKPAFDALPLAHVSSLVKEDILDLNRDTTAFENALIHAAPANLVGKAEAFKKALDPAFAEAIEAYAHA